MIGAVLMFGGTLVFSRICLNKFNINGKNVISIAIALILTLFLNSIQLLLNFLLGLIF
jgi:hypothetical protein